MYYCNATPEKLALMESFTEKPSEFKHMDLVAQMESISLVQAAQVNVEEVNKQKWTRDSANKYEISDNGQFRTFYYKYVLKHFACIYTIVITLNSPTLPRTRKVGMFRISNIGLVIEVTLQEHRGPFRN